MPNDNNKILKCNHGEKSMRSPFVIYADLECFLAKMHSCQNNNEKSYTKKKIKHTPSGYTHCLQIVHLMKQKTNLIFTKAKTVWKAFVKA